MLDIVHVCLELLPCVLLNTQQHGTIHQRDFFGYKPVSINFVLIDMDPSQDCRKLNAVEVEFQISRSIVKEALQR